MNKSKYVFIGTLAVLLVLGGAVLFVADVSTDDFADSSCSENIDEHDFPGVHSGDVIDITDVDPFEPCINVQDIK